MQVILDADEAWSVMTLVISQVLDQTELSEEGKALVRQWRIDRADGTAEMGDLTISMNESLGAVLDEKMTRLIRRKGWYVSTKEGGRGMKVEFEKEEAWNLLSHIVGRLLDETPLTDSDRAKVRRWKSDEMRLTSQEMQVVTDKINEDIRQTLQRKTNSQIRRPDWVSPTG